MILRNFRRSFAAAAALACLVCAPLAGAVRSPEATLVPFATGDGARDDVFGFSIAMTDQYAAFGVPFDDIGGNNDRGSVHVFRRSGNQWLLDAKLTGDALAGVAFGWSVAFAGDSLVVGAPRQGLGKGLVYVFERGTGAWAETARLQPATPIDGEGYGYALAASGNRIVVGTGGSSFDAFYGCGRNRAYTYERSTPGWIDTGSIAAPATAADRCFGSTVAVEGDRVAIGAPNEPSLGFGAVYTYIRDGSGWTSEQRLQPQFAAFNFGKSIAMRGSRIAIGAPSDGTAYVDQVQMFVRTGTSWTFEGSAESGTVEYGIGVSVVLGDNRLYAGAPLAPAGGIQEFGIFGGSWSPLTLATRNDSRDRGWFGRNFAERNGVVMASAATAPSNGYRNQGEVLSFADVGSSWLRLPSFDAGVGASDHGYGMVADLDGFRLAVGVPSWLSGDFFNPELLGPGSLEIHERAGGSWARVAHVRAPGGNDYASFGACVDLAPDDVLVTAPDALRDTRRFGKAWLFSRTSGWTAAQELVTPDAQGLGMGYACARDANTIALLAYSPTSVVIFRRSGSTWAHDARVVLDGVDYASTVAVAQDTIMVGSPGIVRVLRRSAGTWSQVQALTAVNGASTLFGNALAAEANRLYVGAQDLGQGEIELFTRADGASPWSYEGALGPIGGIAAERFGGRIDFDADRLIATGDSGTYLFARVGASWSFDALFPANGIAVTQGAVATGAPDENGAGVLGNPREGRIRMYVSDGFADGFE